MARASPGTRGHVVRILPDNPSLTFLRQEAKDLLAAMRESNPEASLSDAQQALAAEYGMRDWPALKTEVERLGADVPVAPDGFAEELAGAFGLGRVTKPASPVSFTPMGRSWSITTDQGRWVAITGYWWMDADQAEIGNRLCEAAVAAGISAPKPVRSRNGRLAETVQGQSWRIREWMVVGPSPVMPISSGVAHRVGWTFGTLHSLAIPSEAPINPYLTERRPESDWHNLVGQARASGKPWADRFGESLPALLDLRAIELDIEGEDLILCNQNVQPENVRTGHNNQLVVTEWDFAGSQTPELELGTALTHWVSRPSINHNAIKALRNGYVDAAGNWPKLELSSFATAVTGYLNWVYQTVCASMNSSDKDEMAFAEQETVDLLGRAMTRSQLEELLDAVDG